MVSDKFIEDLRKHCERINKVSGWNYNVENNIHAETDLEYLASNNIPSFKNDELLQYSKEHHFSDVLTYNLISLQNTMDVYWIWRNAIHFLVDIGKVKKLNYLYDTKLFKEADKLGLEEFIFDFSDFDAVVKLSKSYDKLVTGANKPEQDMWCISISRWCKAQEDWSTFEFMLSVEKPYRVYHIIDNMSRINSNINLCERCAICHKINGSGVKLGFEDSFTNRDKVAIMSKNITHTTETQCSLGNPIKLSGFGVFGTEPFLTKDIYDIVNACMYCLDKFFHRKKVVRNIAQGIDDITVDDNLKVKVPRKMKEDNATGVRFVNLDDYVRTERRYKKRITSGHHESPREHYRRPTLRHLKSGKVVPVKGTVVNKGKEKRVVYKV